MYKTCFVINFCGKYTMIKKKRNPSSQKQKGEKWLKILPRDNTTDSEKTAV